MSRQNTKEALRHILGYLIGFSLFAVLIPFGLCELSRAEHSFLDWVPIGSDMARNIVSFLFFFVGMWFAIWSNIFLFDKGKGGPVDAFGVSISPQSKKLVTTGPYKLCRNPMAFGAFSMYLGVAVFLNSIAGVFCVFVFLTLLYFLIKFSEEKRLLRNFGDQYVEYRKKVPMIFPLTRKKEK